MELNVSTLWSVKAGATEDEYEDAFAPKTDGLLSGTLFRFAIADGATQTTFSSMWAEMLVTAYISRNTDTSPTVEEFRDLQSAWWDKVGGLPLPWYGRLKLNDGAAATLLGVELFEELQPQGATAAGRWRAAAIGDSCLFHVREGCLQRAFPLSVTAAFNDSPNLVLSRGGDWNDLLSFMQYCDGTLAEHDSLILCSDALAAWFLLKAETGDPQWIVANTWTQEDFRAVVTRERDLGSLENDDTTLVVIRRLPSQSVAENSSAKPEDSAQSSREQPHALVVPSEAAAGCGTAIETNTRRWPLRLKIREVLTRCFKPWRKR